MGVVLFKEFWSIVQRNNKSRCWRSCIIHPNHSLRINTGIILYIGANSRNYVIQHVIERGKPEDREKIIAGVLGQVLELSKHKFASNVVEKCVAFGSYSDRQHIIDEIMEVNTDSSSPLLAMMKDGFGNYVIQKLLDVTDGEQRAQLVAKIKPQLLALKRYTYGKHLASSMSLIIFINI